MKSSEKIDAVVKALFEAQKDIPHVKKTELNPFHKSTYAGLTSIIDVVKPIFIKHGLMVMQLPSYNESRVVVETIVFHVPSAQWIGCEASTPATESPQGTGSAITYLRRFGLVSMAFIGQEDDDAEGAMGRPQKAAGKSDTLTVLLGLLMTKQVPQEKQAEWKEKAGIKEWSELPEDRMKALIEKLGGK